MLGKDRVNSLGNSLPLTGRDEPEIHYTALDLLRRVTLGDNFKPIAVAPTSPISALQTCQGHCR
jgi:hypothetical protein